MAAERQPPTHPARHRDAVAFAIVLGLMLSLGVRAWCARGKAHAMTADEASTAFASACSLLAVGQYEMAREELMRVAETTTDRGLAMRCLMKSADCIFYDETKPMRERCQEARGAYEKLVGDYPGEAEMAWAQLQIGNALQELALHEEAVSAYKALITRHPNQPHAAAARLKMGLSLLDRGKHEEARKELEDLLQSCPNTPEAAQAAFAIPKTYASPPAKKAEDKATPPKESE